MGTFKKNDPYIYTVNEENGRVILKLNPNAKRKSKHLCHFYSAKFGYSFNKFNSQQSENPSPEMSFPSV